MMQLGVIDANDQMIEATLDGQVFNVGLSWNEECQLWTISLRDLNLDVLVSGIAVVPAWPLLQQFRRPEFPLGELAVYTPVGVGLDRQSFASGTAGLYYFFASEIA